MSGAVSQLRQPEYTGENRCLPCTVVNVLIAVALGGAVAGVGVATGNAGLGVAAGAVLLGLSLVAIYLRGYLVPGTPTLTKRYFPPWLLALFGKEPAEEFGGMAGTDSEETAPDAESLDPEAVLVGVGALEECADGEDLCLTESFRGAWADGIEQARDADREALLDVLGVPGEAETEEFGNAFRLVVDGQEAGRWESRAAFLADLGAAHALEARYDGWSDLPVRARGQLLNGLRLFIDTCPACAGTPEFGTETVESCCSTREVAAVACPDCGARLFETPV
ncbi:MAG: hypothetical protein V5A30_08190 [Haloarculaceae archaeon]